MNYRSMIAAFAGRVSYGSSRRRPFAATASAAKPEARGPIQLAYDFPIYDRVIDPLTAAIRAALATAGTEGSFLDKRDAAGVAEYYAEQGYTPTWTVDGKLTERAKAVIAAHRSRPKSTGSTRRLSRPRHRLDLRPTSRSQADSARPTCCSARRSSPTRATPTPAGSIPAQSARISHTSRTSSIRSRC